MTTLNDNRKLRIVFMGTPEFAVSSLEILYKNNYTIAAVITSVDKPAGRGRQLKMSAVKQFALDHEIPVLQPKNLKSENFLKELRALDANLFVVVAFRMLPEVVWSMPSHGCINLHGSLLPQYRGAAPINWVLINGEVETGLTTFFIDKEIDTGKWIYQSRLDIHPDETAGELHDRMKILGAKLVLKTVNAIENRNFPLHDQDDSQAIKKAPKIQKQDCKIDWSQDVKQIFNFVRGLCPYPAAWSTLNGKSVKIYKVIIAGSLNRETPGTINIENNKLFVACNDTWIHILELQMEGKKRMPIAQFLNGYQLDPQTDRFL